MSLGPKDIEARLRAIQGEVGDAGEAVKPAGIAFGTLLAAGAVGIAFVLGQRNTKKQTTIVEVRKQ